MEKTTIRYRQTSRGYEVIELNGNSLSRVPRTLFGKPVYRLGEFLFKNNKFFTFLQIPEFITELGQGCFYHSSLKRVSGKGIEKVEANCFEGSCDLTCVDFPNLRYVGHSGFYACESLSSISLNNLLYIGEFAFSTTGLTIVDVSKVIAVESSAFSYCIHLLKAIVGSDCPKYYVENNGIPTKISRNGVTYDTIDDEDDESVIDTIRCTNTVIGNTNHLFKGCHALKTVEVYTNTIGIQEFDSCTELESVYAPFAKSIEKYAFDNCKKLRIFGNVKSVNIMYDFTKLADISGKAFLRTSFRFKLKYGIPLLLHRIFK